MAQRFKALAALAEDIVPFPVPIWWLTTTHNFFCPPYVSDIQVYIHTCRVNAGTHKINAPKRCKNK